MPINSSMDTLTFFSSFIEHMAWPLTFLALALLMRKQLQALLGRIASIKHGNTEFQFSKASEILIKESPSLTEKEQIRKRQVVTSKKLETGQYTLYSNGVLVQRFRVGILAGQAATLTVFPVAFPNEVTSIEFIGGVSLQVAELNLGNLKMVHVVSHEDRQIELVVSGL